MKAKLVWVSFGTRVVVPDSATDEDVCEAAYPELLARIQEFGRGDLSVLEAIDEDEDCPYDPETDKNQNNE